MLTSSSKARASAVIRPECQEAVPNYPAGFCGELGLAVDLKGLTSLRYCDVTADAMKMTILFSSFILLTLTTLTADTTGPHITVHGTAMTQVTPDLLVWSLQLRNEGLELSEVAQKHTDLQGTVSRVIEECGIPKKETQTSNMEFGENMIYQNGRRVKDGYFAQTKISFKSSDFNSYKSTWLRLAAIKELSLTSVTYDHSKRIDHQNQNRKKALTAAKEKAKLMAESLNAKIGTVLSIREDSEFTGTRRGEIGTNHISNAVTTLQTHVDNMEETLSPGAIPIMNRVEVTFHLLNQDR